MYNMEEFIENKLIKKENIEEEIVFVSVNDCVKSDSDDVSSNYCYDCLVNDVEEGRHSVTTTQQFHKQNVFNLENKCLIMSEIENGKCNLNKSQDNWNKNSELYKCDLCGYVCCGESEVKKHSLYHIEREQNKSDTIKFNVDTSFSGDFSESHKQNNTGKKLFRCKLCDYSCTAIHSLRKHKKLHTGDKKPYKCTECNYCCAQPGTLKAHIRTHTGEKPYRCNECNFSSAVSSSLIVHRRKHTGEKPYKCNLCNYSCAQPNSLKSHIRTHTGEKPYTCNICDFRFSLQSNLKKHLRRKHAQDQPLQNVISNYM